MEAATLVAVRVAHSGSFSRVIAVPASRHRAGFVHGYTLRFGILRNPAEPIFNFR